MDKGILITFEGVDFSGKSLQASLLRDKLIKAGNSVIFFREPGTTLISEEIRKILLDNKNIKMTAQAELLLYSAARTQLVSEKIIPALESKKIVICDRYFDSTTAYQGYGREIDLDFVEKLNIFVTYNIKPDLTLLVDIDPEIALKRKDDGDRELDRLEKENIDFHKRVRKGYLEIANSGAEKNRFVVLDGRKSVQSIAEEIAGHIKTKLNLKF